MTNSTILEQSTGSDDLDHSPQQSRARRRPPMSRSGSSIEIEKFAEDENDEDFSDILGNDEDTLVKVESDDGGSDRSTLMLNSKLSCNSWLGDVDDEDDPFAQLEEGLDEMDLEANIARDKYARLRNQVEGLVSSLKTSQEDDVLADISEQLVSISFLYIYIFLNFQFLRELATNMSSSVDDFICRFAGDEECHYQRPWHASYSRNS